MNRDMLAPFRRTLNRTSSALSLVGWWHAFSKDSDGIVAVLVSGTTTFANTLFATMEIVGLLFAGPLADHIRPTALIAIECILIGYAFEERRTMSCLTNPTHPPNLGRDSCDKRGREDNRQIREGGHCQPIDENSA